MSTQKVKPFGNGLPGACTYQTVSYDGDNSKNLAFIVLTSSHSSGDDVFDVTAPMQAITIQQTADFSVAKSLDSDFMVAAFGDMPVMITIGGLHMLRMPRGGNKPILDWYRSNKISSGKKNRVKIAINFAGGGAVYNCIAVGLAVEGFKESIDTGTLTYKLTLVGVEKK